MIIQVNDKWRIESDSENWMVERRTDPKDKNKKGSWRLISYHGTVESAMQSLFQRGVREMDGKLTHELMGKIDDFAMECRKAVHRLDEYE